MTHDTLTSTDQTVLPNVSGVSLDTFLSQEGTEGIRFDFTDGCRVFCPPGPQWRVCLRDIETETILFEHHFTGGLVQSSRRSWVRFGLDVWRDDHLVFTHVCDLRGQEVFIDMSLGALGDHLAWIGQADRFRRQHGCLLTCRLKTPLAELLRDAYPDIRIYTPGDIDERSYYAAYKVCVFYNDDQGLFQPVDYRLAGLSSTAAYILGLEPDAVRPRLPPSKIERPIADPYVCIATQASGQSKYWNNPEGWRTVVSFLRGLGFRVICIDQKSLHGQGLVWNHIPYGAEDQTGDRPLAERVWWLRHSAFFIGLSSGLSWLAWAAECQVVMISGFTQPFNEFYTPWRVINRNVCNGCSNDVRHQFDPSDYFWCPRHKDTPRQFECTKAITSSLVISTIRRLMYEKDIPTRGIEDPLINTLGQ
ncbi:autotransporter strand-loop-strand O-heptosyltransferase [Gluconobacter cerinus]|uniref:autotransporter strand-loop-strand O-heptosyltransferase n=1 Tax=Gluconobacter cerinus TaxID=38307 RepID=UPI001B8D24D3|nr:autotransporter strand-loop-strand O-heptosyltransferase [Gluconobacter cerinus]MBS0984465.1 autotransporter strand-loop-strand O-heptosyltransferase [Gluconobacter cerinus]MBS1023486.1 autotransporter strand-loop-strand O-heptosyltransferase [Gluconobacter cerinus]MBS1026483.1 autotransporter strand-loop-strand O-heptosyltransferase [Gluconobacter cerinus]MBS1036064.1 autotransporter strand-loop-strand O-heptosyltransferase [Gluconobacter cerinus]